MPVKRRNPRVETVGITVSAEAKQFIEQQAQLADQSVSDFLRPGLILALVQDYLGLTLSEAIARLIADEATWDAVMAHLNQGDARMSPKAHPRERAIQTE